MGPQVPSACIDGLSEIGRWQLRLPIVLKQRSAQQSFLPGAWRPQLRALPLPVRRHPPDLRWLFRLPQSPELLFS